MEALDFTCCDIDQAVFFHYNQSRLIVVPVHINNCSLVAKTKGTINNFKINIGKYITITDLGKIHWLLGLKIHHDYLNHILYFLQQSYIDFIIYQYSFEDLKPLLLSIDPNICLTSFFTSSSTLKISYIAYIPYHETVGSLIYVALGTCSNIIYTVQAIFYFSSNPLEAHWKAVKQIYYYFLGTKNLWLYYSRKTKKLVNYTDTDRIIAKDCHTISRYVFMLHTRTIS